MEARWGSGNGDNCPDALRFPGFSLHSALVFPVHLPSLPKKVLTKDLVVGRLMPLPKMSTSLSLTPVNLLVMLCGKGKLSFQRESRLLTSRSCNGANVLHCLVRTNAITKVLISKRRRQEGRVRVRVIQCKEGS